MQKSDRHKLILDSVAAGRVTKQGELSQLLRAEGFEVTQASISRDLHELGIVKVGGRYARPEFPRPESSPFGVSAINPSGNSMLVVKCASGLASAVAVKIDSERIPEIVGTIAGDDTIFVAVEDAAAQKAAIKKLRAVFAE